MSYSLPREDIFASGESYHPQKMENGPESIHLNIRKYNTYSHGLNRKPQRIAPVIAACFARASLSLPFALCYPEFLHKLQHYSSGVNP